MSKPKFKLGRVVFKANVVAQIDSIDLLYALERHKAGDWGDVDAHDAAINDLALQPGTEGRLLSVYHDANGTKFWIITEADRSVTTVLLPEDY